MALNLIVLVINALHGLLAFYGKDYTLLNLDGLFGLRIIEGQLKHLYIGRYDDIPTEILAELKAMSINASKLANMALPHVYEDNPSYFKKFKYLIHQPWNIFKEHRLIEKRLLWPRNSRKKDGCPKETESDECIVELLDAAASMAEDWAKEPEEQNVENFGCKRITTKCLERMLGQKGCTGYSLAHQLLYVLVAELVGCLVVADEYAKSIGYEDGTPDFVMEFCSNMYQDAEEIAAGRKLGSRKFGGRELNVHHWDQDLFLEMQFVCGQFGFMEFTRRQWLEAALTWQQPSGCYSNKDSNSRDSTSKQQVPGRKLLIEKELADSCATHKSAVAAGALCIYIRFLMDPGSVDFQHLRLDNQAPSYDSVPLAGRFWSPPARWTYEEQIEEPLPPLPYPVRYRDTTGIWFFAIALCFLYATYRLCRRQNIRYMRWRGLKWR